MVVFYSLPPVISIVIFNAPVREDFVLLPSPDGSDLLPTAKLVLGVDLLTHGTVGSSFPDRHKDPRSTDRQYLVACVAGTTTTVYSGTSE